MKSTLVVVRPFRLYVIGDVIVAPEIVADILASPHADCVVMAAPSVMGG